MMVLRSLFLPVVLSLLTACQAGQSRTVLTASPVQISRSQAEKTLKDLTFPMTRVELAEHFPAAGLSKDPPVFFFLVANDPGDHEYCQLGKDLYLVMRVDYKHGTTHRLYPGHHNPVKRGNRVGSIVIIPDQIDDASILKARPNAGDVIESASLMSGKEPLLEVYQQYKTAESQL